MIKGKEFGNCNCAYGCPLKDLVFSIADRRFILFHPIGSQESLGLSKRVYHMEFFSVAAGF